MDIIEELYESLFGDDDRGATLYQKRVLDKFFKENIVIPKNEKDRHKYADVFHEWFENQSKELQAEISPDGQGGMWAKSKISLSNIHQYRIKPDKDETKQ